ncbi:hypothetical protein N7492_009164 [Penicillium capsulatum]|uniref:Uncharacterized protein n=1 Tax=Penicillium capsulatum TaxID=69766 RepID=A0A9W9HS10_9EURO|nr:hypothetical protein N7492_009164 [Penicillium capsulatum]KAJ6106563.1 hypothetical protein N7512_010080 [Penicillium capsulatum]
MGDLTNPHDERLLHRERYAMPILHKSTNAKVKKSIVPSNISRRCDIQDLGYWTGSDMLPCGGKSMIPEDIGPQVPSHPASLLPYEQWGDRSPWMPRSYYMPPSIDYASFDRDYHFDDLSYASEPLRFGDTSSSGNMPHIETIPPTVEPFVLPGTEPSSVLDEIWGDPLTSDMPSSKNELSLLPEATHGANSEPKYIRQKLLKIDIGLIEDLDCLESGSIISGLPSFLKADINLTVGKLDLPIFRMLNHSVQFLDIIQSGSTLSGDSADLAAFETGQTESTIQEDRRCHNAPSTESNTEDGATTTSSNDSGYFTMTPSSCHQSKVSSSDFDMPTCLSLLATYCHLIRVYRSVFMQLYQLFLVLPPADAGTFLLLPSLQFGQLHMAGNLPAQVQMLTDIASNLLSRIESALGMSPGSHREVGSGMTTFETVQEDSPLALIKKQIMVQEHVECGISLQETIDGLRQLVKDNTSA